MAGSVQRAARALSHDFEGLGQVDTHDVDLHQLADLPSPLAPSFVRRWLAKLKLEFFSLPYVLGFRRPAPRPAIAPGK